MYMLKAKIETVASSESYRESGLLETDTSSYIVNITLELQTESFNK